MKQNFKLVCGILLLTCLFTSCSPAVSADIPTVPEEGFSYNNLIDPVSQSAVKDLMRSADIPSAAVDTFMDLVTDYNSRITVWDDRFGDFMEEEELFDFEEGFISTTDPYISYGEYYPYMKRWMLTTEEEDILCRIGAFLLMQDKIEVNRPLSKEEWDIGEEGYMISDFDGMRNPLIHFSDQEQGDYFTLFHPVYCDGQTLSPAQMSDLITEQWKSHGVIFDTKTVSLISIWSASFDAIHSSHAGVLIELDGACLLVEKTNPFFPYQVGVFADVDDVKAYMIHTLTHYFESYDINTPEMVVLRNDERL